MLNTIILNVLVYCGIVKKPNFTIEIVTHNLASGAIQNNKIFIVQNGMLRKWACFLCPCGCKEKLQLSLNTKKHPCWTVNFDWLRRPTFYPSVNIQEGCYAHFWIKEGNVVWCDDTGIKPSSIVRDYQKKKSTKGLDFLV